MDPRLLPAGMTENWVMPDISHRASIFAGLGMDSPLTTGRDDGGGAGMMENSAPLKRGLTAEVLLA